MCQQPQQKFDIQYKTGLRRPVGLLGTAQPGADNPRRHSGSTGESKISFQMYRLVLCVLLRGKLSCVYGLSVINTGKQCEPSYKFGPKRIARR